MRRLLVIAMSALMLTGCIAEWKNPNGPQRWSTGLEVAPIQNNGTPQLENSGSPALPSPH